MGSNPTRGIYVCVILFCVCVVLCVGSGLRKGWSPVCKESYQRVKDQETKKAAMIQQKALEPQTDR
jgi:hypothetical protein